MQKKEIIQRENEVIIHQSVARIRGTLTPIQSRSMLAILKRANEQVAENPNVINFTISTSQFLDDIQDKDNTGLETKVTKIHKHLRALMVKTFMWGTQNDINECVFMQQIRVTNTEVTFIFSNYIRDHIKPLSKALIIKDFELIQSFRSEYARQLYKHLMSWEEQQSLYLTLKDFKDFLGVPKTKSYERINNLKSKVINVAINEINEKCPWMKLEYSNKTLPRSRTIEGFDFSWSLKTDVFEEYKKKKIKDQNFIDRAKKKKIKTFKQDEEYENSNQPQLPFNNEIDSKL